MKNIILSCLMLTAALVLAACSGPADSPETATVQEILIEANEFSFEPATIEVVAGQPVKLTLKNDGALEHDLSVMHIAVHDVREHSQTTAGHDEHMHAMDEEPDLHVSAMMGESGMVEFTPTEPGTYEIVCTVAGHEEAGMVGALIVTAP